MYIDCNFIICSYMYYYVLLCDVYSDICSCIYNQYGSVKISIFWIKKSLSYLVLSEPSSILTVLKPCLIILHGNVKYTGNYWDVMLPLATNVVYVHKEPQTTTISGRKIFHIQNQADIGRIQILLGKSHKNLYSNYLFQLLCAM